jgi:hypothetical protein
MAPVPSPRICTSMCRARGMNASTIDVGAAEGGLGLGLAAVEGTARSSSSASTARVPRPPPPATALMIMAPPSPRLAKKDLRFVQGDWRGQGRG